MLAFLLTVHMIVAIVLIALILIQRGKGADIGAAFGSGASQTLFGSRGTANFLTRTTAILATVFFLCNLGLAWLYAQQQTGPASVTQSVITEQPPAKKAQTPTPPVEAPTAPKAPEVPK